MSTAPQWLTQWEYAHRGLHSIGVPENSLAASEAAIAAKLGVECDIQRAADGCPMVFHDWELDRMAQYKGEITGLTRKELEGIALVTNGEPIPSLSELLAKVACEVPLLIEIKSKPGYDVENTCLAVDAELSGYAGDHAVMSFDPRVSAWFRQNSPETAVGLVMREDELGNTQTQIAREATLLRARPDFLAYHIQALPSPWVARLRSEGMPILTWTVASPEARKRAIVNADALVSEGKGLA